MLEQIFLTMISIFIYLFIRNNYFKIANKFLDFMVIIVVIELVYMYFGNVSITEDLFGVTIGSLIFLVIFNILEKKQNKYMKEIYKYFQNFNETIWFIKNSSIYNEQDIIKIEHNIKTVLKNKLMVKKKGIYLISVSKKERVIRYILLFTSRLECEKYFNSIKNDYKLEKFNIKDKGILTLEYEF